MFPIKDPIYKALKMLVAILNTPFINYNIKIQDEKDAKKLANALKDGKLSDEDSALLIDIIAEDFKENFSLWS